MSDVKRFFKHSSIYAIGNIANRVGAFLLLPLYTHYMTVEQYGTLELFYVTSDLIGALLSVGLAHATLRFYFEYKELSERNRVVSTCIIATAFYSVLFMFFLSHFNLKFARMIFQNPRYADTFNLVYGIIVFELLRQIGLAYIRAKEYSTLYVAVCVIQLCLQVGINVYTVGVRHMAVQGVLIGNLASVAAGSAFVLGLVAKECGFGFDWHKMKEILKYSYPFLLTAVVSVLMQNADRILLKIFFTLEDVGLYSLAAKFGSLLQVLVLDPYNRNFGSYRFAIMNDKNNKEILVRIYDYLMMGLFFMGLGISLYSYEVLKIMTEPAFWPAYSLIPLFVLANAIGGSNYTFQTGILYSKKTQYMVYISAVSSSINILLYILLIPKYGAVGAISTIIIKILCEVILVYSISNRLYYIPYDNWKTVKMLGIAAALVLAARFASIENIAAALAFKTVLIVLYPVLLYRTGCVTPDERDTLLGFARSSWERLRGFSLLRGS